MANLLITEISSLAGIIENGALKLKGAEMAQFHAIADAWLWIENGKISDYGEMRNLDSSRFESIAHNRISAKDRFVLPCFVDSHTHIVFAKTREEEFVMRIKGKTYEEIAESGGGILNSAKRLQEMSEDELFVQAKQRLWDLIAFGTGAIEIKSGYGLTVVDELKMLRVIKRLKAISPIPIKATFLGAHAIPSAYKANRADYIRLIIEEMLPAVHAENLADYMDVFCDQGFFTPTETDALLEAAKSYGLKAKIHGNELGYTGGVQAAVRNHALSVDHLEYTGDDEIKCLLQSDTMPVALPGCSFFLGIPYAPLRKMIDAGLPVCLASDFNPGSTPNGRMGFVVALACTQMKLSPEEALNATTINGAYALELSHEIGSITRGKRANVFITKPMSSLAIMPYYFGVDQVSKVIINGEVFDSH
ncbi:MAG: imidazolonepropionase [Sphingobacteriales bacterium]|jgi:imidazolonepropionase|nr:imidazolonepropionase [Sphingobacteriales bacterium]